MNKLEEDFFDWRFRTITQEERNQILNEEIGEIPGISKEIQTYALLLDREGEIDVKKIKKEYEQLCREGFVPGEELFLTAVYFAGKPDETVEPLARRLTMMMGQRQDLIGGGILAASYYGMEELAMRLPMLENGAASIFSEKESLELFTAIIMLADGSPAEVAKMIPLYLELPKKGISVQGKKMAAVLGLLSVIAPTPLRVGRELLDRVGKQGLGTPEEVQEAFYIEVCHYIRKMEEKERQKTERTTSRMLTGEKNVTAADYVEEEGISLNGSNLLTGMGQEVNYLLSAICLCG